MLVQRTVRRTWLKSCLFASIRRMSSSGSSMLEIPPGYEMITEGQASMLYSKDETCFYNKVQEFNRDTSIQVISHYVEVRQREYEEKQAKKRAALEAIVTAGGQKGPADEAATTAAKEAKETLDQLVPFPGIHVLDALAATGLRSVRYLKVSHIP